MPNLTEFLRDRQTSYGDAWRYTGRAMQPVMHLLNRLIAKYPELYMPWVMILNKLIRILAVPDRADSWYDIIGYATLVYESLNKPEDK